MQDLGRPGWGAWGVPASGALDEEALRLANRLVGNPRTPQRSRSRSTGPVLKAIGDLVVAVVGRPVRSRARRGDPRRGRPDPRARRRPGAVARRRRRRGGIDVPKVLGSRSTCVSARFGGFQGRRLQKGDVLAVGVPFAPPLARARERSTSAGGRRRPARDAGTAGGLLRPRRARGVLGRSVPGPAGVQPDGGPPARCRRSASSRPRRSRPRARRREPSRSRRPGSPSSCSPSGRRPAATRRSRRSPSADLGLLARTAPGRSVRFERIAVTNARRLLAEREVAPPDRERSMTLQAVDYRKKPRFAVDLNFDGGRRLRRQAAHGVRREREHRLRRARGRRALDAEGDAPRAPPLRRDQRPPVVQGHGGLRSRRASRSRPRSSSSSSEPDRDAPEHRAPGGGRARRRQAARRALPRVRAPTRSRARGRAARRTSISPASRPRHVARARSSSRRAPALEMAVAVEGFADRAYRPERQPRAAGRAGRPRDGAEGRRGRRPSRSSASAA